MRTITPRNNAKNVRVGREGDVVVIELNFPRGESKTGRINAATLVGLGRKQQIHTGNLYVRRDDHQPNPRRKAVDTFWVAIGGGGPDLALVSRAALLRAAGLSR